LLLHNEQNRGVQLLALSLIVLVVILFFGLRLNDFTFSNKVNWIKYQPGISFGKYGIAYNCPFNGPIEKNTFGSNGFSIEIAIKPESYAKEGSLGRW